VGQPARAGEHGETLGRFRLRRQLEDGARAGRSTRYGRAVERAGAIGSQGAFGDAAIRGSSPETVRYAVIPLLRVEQVRRIETCCILESPH